VLNLIIRIGIAVIIVIATVLLIRLVWFAFKRLRAKVDEYGSKHFKPLTIKKLNLLDVKQMMTVIFFALQLAKYVVALFIVVLSIPIVFSLFPQTRNLASVLFGYILTPLKTIGGNIVGYIPNLFTIAIILFIVRYALRALKFFTTQIERGKLVIPGFYADWAQPTARILQIFFYAFTVAMIYPYLPGSGSGAFQGVSVFVGLIISLGSSAAIGNLVAGIVITYMRPFKIGDRIKLGDTVGFVVERSPIVIRIRTHKNEYVTVPNQMVLNSSIVNYRTSSESQEGGLIMHAAVTMTYEVPWRKVHEILLEAARKTSRTESTPKPYVLQTALDDNYCCYEINVYTKHVEQLPSIYSELYGHLQDGFDAAKVSLTAPHYRIHIGRTEEQHNLLSFSGKESAAPV